MSQTQSIRAADDPIDLEHLAVYTGGDTELQKDVLEIFAQQADTYIRNLVTATEASVWKDAAHTLKGAARGIGAWPLADLCIQAEQLADNGNPARRSIILGDIKAAIADVVEFIRGHLN